MFDLEARLHNGHNDTSNLADCVDEMYQAAANRFRNSPEYLLDIAEYLLQFADDKKLANDFKEIINAHLISNEQIREWEAEDKALKQEYYDGVKVG